MRLPPPAPGGAAPAGILAPLLLVSPVRAAARLGPSAPALAPQVLALLEALGARTGRGGPAERQRHRSRRGEWGGAGGAAAAGAAVVTSGESMRGRLGGRPPSPSPRGLGCRGGGLDLFALSSAASQPLRAGGSLPKTGAVHPPRQVSGCPRPPPVPAGELRAPLAARARGAARPGGRERGRDGRKSPSLGSAVPGWPSTGSPAPSDPTPIFM